MALIVGETVCPITGELLKSQVTRDLDGLEDQLNEVFDRALVAFKNHHSDLTQREALRDFIRFVKCRADVVRIQQLEQPIDDAF